MDMKRSALILFCIWVWSSRSECLSVPHFIFRCSCLCVQWNKPGKLAQQLTICVFLGTSLRFAFVYVDNMLLAVRLPSAAVYHITTKTVNMHNVCSLSVGHSESRRMTDELGSRQRDLSTSSVTKRANGHWHAIIASSCRWSQREYKRQPVHRINHPFASEPSGGVSLLLFLTLREASRVRALRHSSGGRGLTGEQRSVKTVTQECAVASSPACFSTKRADFSKRVHRWSRLFKDVLSPVRFWVRSISGASGRSRSLPHVSGHSARWGSFRGWFMFFLWGHDHLGVAQ